MAITLAQAIPTGWTMAGVDVESNELTVTAGNSLLIGVILDDTATTTVTSVAIEGESNATPVGSIFDASVGSRGQRIQYFVLDEILNSGTKDITVQLSAAGSMNVWAAELVGADLTGIVDVDGGGASGSSASASDGLTTTAANSAIFMFGNFAGSEGTADGDSTAFDLSNLWLYYGGQYDLDAGAAGAKTPTLTVSSGEWAVRSIAIKAAGAGGGTALDATSVTLTITANAASITTGSSFGATTVTKTITVNAATVNAANSFVATSATKSLTENAAITGSPVNIVATSETFDLLPGELDLAFHFGASVADKTVTANAAVIASAVTFMATSVLKTLVEQNATTGFGAAFLPATVTKTITGNAAVIAFGTMAHEAQVFDISTRRAGVTLGGVPVGGVKADSRLGISLGMRIGM